MNVSITPELQLMIQQQVESGRYNNASEVVRAALRLFEQHEVEQREHRERLREMLARSLAEADAGDTIPAEVVLAGFRDLVGLADGEVDDGGESATEAS